MIEAAVRSAALTLAAMALLWAFRVQSARARLTVLNAVLYTSILMPAALLLPRLELPLLPAVETPRPSIRPRRRALDTARTHRR